MAATYALWITTMNTGSFSLGILAGLVSALTMGGILFWLSMRLEPDGLGVMSIAVHLILIATVLNADTFTRGALGIPGIARVAFAQSMESFAAVSLLLACVWIFFMWRVDRSAIGRALSALSEHEWHAESLGVSRAKTHGIGFAIASIGALITAFLFPQYLFLLHPNDLQFPAMIIIVMYVVAGNPGSVRGVVLSTILLITMKEALRFTHLPPTVIGPVNLILFGGILFAAVWWRKDTLFPPKRAV
jgi:branched-chain amino acid transport system permease protein